MLNTKKLPSVVACAAAKPLAATGKTTLARVVMGSVVALAALLAPSGAAAADAEPKPEARSQIDWAMLACNMGTDPTTHRDEVPKHLAKFREKRDLAIAADPAIKTWNGEKRGKKVAEWLPRCDKELSERVERDRHGAEVKYALERALTQCSIKIGRAPLQADLDEYKRLRAAAVAVNKSETFIMPPGDKAAAELARCDKDFPASVAATAKADAEAKEANEKHYKAAQDRRLAEAAKEKAQEAAERKSLKGDRLKIYNKYGSPFRIDKGDTLAKAQEWKWNEHFERGVFDGWCQTTVTFRGNKKVREIESGPGCKLR